MISPGIIQNGNHNTIISLLEYIKDLKGSYSGKLFSKEYKFYYFEPNLKTNTFEIIFKVH